MYFQYIDTFMMTQKRIRKTFLLLLQQIHFKDIRKNVFLFYIFLTYIKICLKRNNKVFQSNFQFLLVKMMNVRNRDILIKFSRGFNIPFSNLLTEAIRFCIFLQSMN